MGDGGRGAAAWTARLETPWTAPALATALTADPGLGPALRAHLRELTPAARCGSIALAPPLRRPRRPPLPTDARPTDHLLLLSRPSPPPPPPPLPAPFAPACASVPPRDPGHREARAKRPDLVPSRNRARAALAVRLAVLRQAASGKAGKDQEHVLALLEPLLEDKDDWPRLTAEAVKDPSTPYDVEAVLQASAAGKDMLKRLEEALEAAHESLGGLRPAEEKFMAKAAAVSKETKHSHFVLRSSVAREEDHGDFRVTGTGL